MPTYKNNYLGVINIPIHGWLQTIITHQSPQLQQLQHTIFKHVFYLKKIVSVKFYSDFCFGKNLDNVCHPLL